MDAAQQHGQQSVQLARQIENTDRFVPSEVFLTRLKLAQGDVAGAAAILAKADQFVRQHNFVHRTPEVAAAQVLTSLHQGNLAAAAHLAEKHELPISQARVHLAQGDTGKALASLEPLRRQVEAKGWEDERLKVMVLQAVALYGTDPAQATTVWLAIESVCDGIGGGNEILGGVWVLLTSWVALQAGRLPKALNYVGIVIGVAGILSALPGLGEVKLIFGLVQIVWFVWLGIIMLLPTRSPTFIMRLGPPLRTRQLSP